MNHDVLNYKKASLAYLDVNSLYPELPKSIQQINIEVQMKKRYTTLWEMKQRLKALVAQIRAEKASYHYHTRSQYEFRHLHIARCLIKGRTIEEVEGSPDSHTRKGNKPDMKYVETLVAEWKPKHEAEVAEMKREFELARASSAGTGGPEVATPEMVPVMARA